MSKICCRNVYLGPQYKFRSVHAPIYLDNGTFHRD